ncbi:MAG: hypothetical protein U9O95_04035 [Candidatus Marinimicrobia bacterium]|nr:hypothetical protein [Candidatus Neomarinimicrobiota bacterium]
MKTKYLVILMVIVLLLASCDLFNPTTGTLILKGVRSLPTPALSKAQVVSVPTGSYSMHTKDIKFNFKEIYVSTSLVDSGISDDFIWKLIGEDDTLRSLDEVEFIANDLPEGIYKSLKIVFGNEIIRYAVYASDTSRTVEMASSLTEGDAGDTTEVINYFSPGGSYYTHNDTFNLMSEGESFQEFNINAGQTTTIYWMIGDTTVQWTEYGFTWVDVDNNLAWTPGVDSTKNYWGPPNIPMWSFLVVEE